MKNKIVLLKIVFFFIVVCLLPQTSCKKNTDSTSEAPPVASIALEKSSASQFESVILLAKNITLNQPSYSGTINGRNVVLLTYEDKLALLIPDSISGIQTLKAVIEGNDLSLEINITPLPPISDPVTYVNSYNNDLNQQLTELRQSFDSLSGIINVTKVLQDLQSIQAKVDSSIYEFQNATIQEKAVCARVIDANKTWLNQYNESVDSLNQTLQYFLKMKKKGILNTEDLEKAVNQAMLCFIHSVIKTVWSIPKVIALSGIGLLLPPPAGLVVGRITSGIAIGVFLHNFINLIAQEEKILNLVPTVLTDFSINSKPILTFSNNVAKTLYVEGNYRTICNLDKNTNETLLRESVSKISTLYNCWGIVSKALKTLLYYKPSSIDELTNPNADILAIYADYLSVSNITNTHVSSSSENVNGDFNITFTTDESIDENFSFDIAYQNSGVSKVSKTFDAVLIFNGTFIGTSYGSETCEWLPGCIIKKNWTFNVNINIENQVGSIRYNMGYPVPTIISGSCDPGPAYSSGEFGDELLINGNNLSSTIDLGGCLLKFIGTRNANNITGSISLTGECACGGLVSNITLNIQ